MHLFRCMNNNIYSLNAYTLYKCTYILHTEQKLPIPRVGRKWYLFYFDFNNTFENKHFVSKIYVFPILILYSK